MAIKFNVEPYFDDFNTAGSDGLSPREKYHRVLFRPGHAVQARELTQLQSILQNQITEFGRHFFKEGSMVIPGHVSTESKVDYVKVASVTGVSVSQLEGLTLVGTSGIKIKIKKAVDAAGSDPITLYVKYLNSGTGGETVVTEGEVLTDGNASITAEALDAVGFGSVCFVSEGIYFIEGNFVTVQEDSVVLDKYDTDPSYDIGLSITENIETSAGDPSLNDNATGAPNYAAPGAHRYEITSQLVKQAVEGNEFESFVLLSRIEEGIVTKEVRQTDYSVLEETLARRTFDESGNYTVQPFLINVREHTDVNIPGDEAKLVAGLEPSKAYVRGYELETLATRYVDVNKAREVELFEAASVPMTIGNYININNVDGIPRIDDFEKIELKDAGASIIGYCRARSIVYDGAGQYRLFIFDIQMEDDPVTGGFQPFDNTRTLRGAGTPEFTADLVLVNSNARLFEPNNNTMIFSLPFDRVKTCDSQPDGEADDFNYIYFCNRLIGAEAISGGEVPFSTVGTQEQFEPFDDENWILCVSNGNDTGTIIPLTSGQVNIDAASQNVTISGLSSYEGQTVKLIAGVKRSIEHKSKSLTTNGQPNVELYPIPVPGVVNNLGKADGYKLRAVYMSADLSTPATTSDPDVSEYYDFDNGQTDNYYGITKIRLKPYSAFQPTGQLLVKYEYFTHVGSGDFFSVDSYYGLTDSEGQTVKYEDIPNFISNNGQSVELRSVIDFRPRQDDSGGNFSGTGSVSSLCPEPATTFTTDIQYYLNRIDKIYIDKDGKFGVTAGVPSLAPELPQDTKDSMTLYHLFIPGYTLTPNEVTITMVDNKRYTMRDIGKLEKRINSIEYYTSLTLLEKEAADKQIVDPTTLVQRAKAGFLVDSFTSHAVSNVTSPEFRAAIDRNTRTLRPLFTEDNTRLLHNVDLSSNVQRTGSLITLPYAEQSLVFQNKASSFINVNPYDVFEWTGSIELSPTSDEWKDTSRRPNVIVDQEGVYDAMLGIINETDALGTVWNEWQTNWSGSTSVETDVRRFGNGSERGRGNRTEATVITTTLTGQSRRGLETAVVPDTITTNLGDRVVEINFAPFVRSRIITFKATRLKPNTQVYPFFDGVDVSAFCRDEPSFIKHEELDNPTVVGRNNYEAHPLGSGSLITDDNGTVTGSFFIPNNDTKSFQTGSRIFKLTDSVSNNNNLSTTRAEAAYTAKGLIETKENVTISTRVPLIERRETFEDRVVTNTRTTNQVRWTDPLAQSFMVDTAGGVFLTSIDLFFHTKSSNVPVTLQIREMNQGIPTQTVVPFSEVTLNPSEVTVATPGTSDPAQQTKFVFPSPVYLQENQEYCFVVLANSNEYQLWYAQTGQDNFSTGERISKQPYAGVLFKSQNASTWSPDQNKDLKFRLNRAEFNIDNDGILVLNNGEVQKRALAKNPFVTTTGSNVVRVLHRNHHMFNETNNIGSYVTISGATDVNGIPASEINGTHLVSAVEMDAYNITVTTNATGTGIDGGIEVEATENQLINTFYPFVQQLIFPGTNALYAARMTSGMSLGATTPTPYVTDSIFTPLIVNQNFTTDRPKVIAANVNEVSGKSFYLRSTLTSTKTNLSPVIDLERCSLFTIANRIDNPTDASIPVQDRPAGSHVVANFVAETAATNGSVAAKYVTKRVVLNEAADGIRIFFDSVRPSLTDIEVYVKTGATEEQLASLQWVELSSNSIIPFSDNSTNFNEVQMEYDPAQIFSIFEVKIVLKSRNSSRIPLVRDLRIITLAP